MVLWRMLPFCFTPWEIHYSWTPLYTTKTPSQKRHPLLFLLCSPKGVSQQRFCFALVKGLQPKCIQEMYFEGRNPGEGLTCRAKKGNCHQNQHRAYKGLIRCIVCSGRRFSGWDLVWFQPLKFVKLKDWVDFVLRDWLVFLLRDWLVLCLVGQKQSVVLWLWLQKQRAYLSLALFSGPGCASLTGPFIQHIGLYKLVNLFFPWVCKGKL